MNSASGNSFRIHNKKLANGPCYYNHQSLHFTETSSQLTLPPPELPPPRTYPIHHQNMME